MVYCLYLFHWYSFTMSVYYVALLRSCLHISGKPSPGDLMKTGKSSEESRRKAAVQQTEQLVELFNKVV